MRAASFSSHSALFITVRVIVDYIISALWVDSLHLVQTRWDFPWARQCICCWLASCDFCPEDGGDKFSETLVTKYKATWRHNPEHHNPLRVHKLNKDCITPISRVQRLPSRRCLKNAVERYRKSEVSSGMTFIPSFTKVVALMFLIMKSVFESDILVDKQLPKPFHFVFRLRQPSSVIDCGPLCRDTLWP
jgi:hypothetical protein